MGVSKLAEKKAIFKTNFVLYCRASGGEWVNKGEWEEAEEATALSAAHAADDESEWQAVRLMNVRTYPDGRTPQETIAWMTGIPKGGAGKVRGGGGGGDGGEVQAIAGRDPGKKKKKKKKKSAEGASASYKKIARQQLEAMGTIGGASSVQQAADQSAQMEAEAEDDKAPPMAAVVTRMFTVFAIAAIISFIAKFPLEIILSAMNNSGVEIPEFLVAGLVPAVHLFTFVVSGLILAKTLLKAGDMDALTGFWSKIQNPQEDEDDEEDEYDSGLGGWRTEGGEDDPMGDLEDAADDDGEADGDAGPGDDADGGAGNASDPDLAYSPDAVPAEPRKNMLKFLEGALGTIRNQFAKLDKLGKFGLNLYLAGAGDALAQANGLEGAERNGMITEAIVAIGTKKKMAGPFCDKFDDYENDTKSKAMIDAGRSAMQRFIDGDEKAFADLPKILEGFTSNKAAKASAQGVVIVMFTDLVGSTKMTEELGDLGAQQVVRTHNAIVRNALAAYHGREVKHTGDGIMAVYSNAANAVASTMVMQQEFAKNNGIPGNPPVRVRIGLNAGQAVEEEDDFFGTTVQLSARVCDKADADQIFITQAVKDLVTGHAIQFKPAGDFDMKGISKPVPVFEVVWNAQLQATG